MSTATLASPGRFVSLSVWFGSAVCAGMNLSQGAMNTKLCMSHMCKHARAEHRKFPDQLTARLSSAEHLSSISTHSAPECTNPRKIGMFAVSAQSESCVDLLPHWLHASANEILS